LAGAIEQVAKLDAQLLVLWQTALEAEITVLLSRDTDARTAMSGGHPVRTAHMGMRR
jgi:hypothetical protein